MNNKKRFKEFEQLGKFMSLFNNETERGASLLAASFIDETLGNILTAFLADIPESINLINDYNAPMGTLYSRASCAYALGLIQKNEYDEINIIRRIRNEFGHHWEDISFENQKIVDLCKNLPWLGPPELDENNPKYRFNTTVAILLTDLMWREKLVIKKRREIIEWPNKIRSSEIANKWTDRP